MAKKEKKEKKKKASLVSFLAGGALVALLGFGGGALGLGTGFFGQGDGENKDTITKDEITVTVTPVEEQQEVEPTGNVEKQPVTISITVIGTDITLEDQKLDSMEDVLLQITDLVDGDLSIADVELHVDEGIVATVEDLKNILENNGIRFTICDEY